MDEDDDGSDMSDSGYSDEEEDYGDNRCMVRRGRNVANYTTPFLPECVEERRNVYSNLPDRH